MRVSQGAGLDEKYYGLAAAVCTVVRPVRGTLSAQLISAQRTTNKLNLEILHSAAPS